MNRPAFDRVGEQFLDHYDTVRGHVRQELTRRYLLEQINECDVTSGKVVDVGGGDGRDLRWLSETAGNYSYLTLVEESHKMLRAAKKKSSDQFRLRVGTAQSFARRKTEQSKYDLVLSHGVLQYDLDDPQGHVDGLVTLCKPGGLISLLTKGFAGALEQLERPDRNASPEEIAHFKETGISHNNLGGKKKVRRRAYRYDELKDMLIEAGAQVVAFSGVRVASDKDTRLWRTVPYPELLGILANEYTAGKDRHRRHTAQMLHVMARREV